MRVAVVTETFHPFLGGSSRRYLQVFRRLVKSGFEVDLYTARLSRDWAVKEEIDGIRVFRSPKVYGNFITMDGFRDVSQVLEFSLWTAKTLLKRGEYNLVEANHCPIFPAMASWLRAKLKKTPLTVTFHEAWHREWLLYTPRKIYAPVGMILEKALTWLPDVGIACSNFTAKRLAGLLGMKKWKIEVIPNGVDLNLIRQVKAERERWKIIYAGRLNPHKKVEWLIKAFKMLKREFPDATLEIIGDGPMYTKYRGYAEKNNVKDHVIFRGKVDDFELIRAMKSSWIYVLPSIREGQSITTLEAMASGTPQIVMEVDGNGAADLVAESKSGVRVKPSVRELYKAMKKLLEDEKEWEKLSENGRRYASKFTWDKAAQKHKKLYESLAENS